MLIYIPSNSYICRYKIVVACEEHLSTVSCRHTELEEVDTAFRQYVQKEIR